MNELNAHWSEVTRHLQAGRDALPEGVPADGVRARLMEEFDQFLAENELGLAWDAMAELIDGREDTALVWFNLVEAASLMNLAERKERAIRAMIAAWPGKDSPRRLGYLNERARSAG